MRNHCRSLWRFLEIAALVGVTTGLTPGKAAVPDRGASRTGVLLMAHGGNKDWNNQVRGVADQVNKQFPTEVALGMANRATLQRGIDALVARGAKQIVAVPLFVSSHSSVINATKYLLGLRRDAPKELADFAMDHDMPGMPGHAMPAPKVGQSPALPQPIKSPVPVRMAPALDRNPIVAEILADRAAATAKVPARDVLILVAHGPNDDAENNQWLADMRALAQQIAKHTSYARIECLTLRDDAGAPIRNQATAELRQRVQAANDAGHHALVVPLLLSYGGIENGLRKRLDGIEHTFATQALLPDQRIPQWVIDSVRREQTLR